MAVRQPDPTPGLEPERGLVLAVLAQGVDAEDEIGEFEELTRTAGVRPVARILQHRPQPDPRTYVGKGKLDELKIEYGRVKAEVVDVDKVSNEDGSAGRLEKEIHDLLFAAEATAH